MMDDLKEESGAKPLPTPPFVVIPGVANFRDLGGYATPRSRNHCIRSRFVYRSGEPSQVTTEGIKVLQSLGITHVYDLRSNTEIESSIAAGKAGIVVWEPTTRVFAPVFADKDYSPQALAIRFRNYGKEGTEGFVFAYQSILENAPTSYRQILLHIANDPSKPLIIHCTAGKDRTGVICAVILSLCGVDDNTIAHEYSLTEIGLQEWKQKAINDLLSKPQLDFSQKEASNMLSAKAVNMLAFLRLLHENYGGAEGYVREWCGLSSEDVEKIRFNMSVEEAPVHGLSKFDHE